LRGISLFPFPQVLRQKRIKGGLIKGLGIEKSSVVRSMDFHEFLRLARSGIKRLPMAKGNDLVLPAVED
jgi:hypothetical protein